MSILVYDEIKDKPATLAAMTGLSKSQFEALCIPFTKAWKDAEDEDKISSKVGRKPKLSSVEAKLFFILFYLKNYPLQEVMGHLFCISQGQTSFWIHKLNKVLKKALEDKEHTSPTLTKEVMNRLAEGKIRV
ncbi:MAG: transposase family protein [Gammaproteobacteria bacterium]|nr:transposase family protein [Gammaproteobacteria bacterium]NNJ84959.1 transposase family protein [Gammaproteobacteria bacterium]